MLQNGNSEYRSYVDLTPKRHRKIHVENSSIFRRFWKSNPRRIDVIISHGFAFRNRCSFHELSTWNFDVESMANRRRCVHWEGKGLMLLQYLHVAINQHSVSTEMSQVKGKISKGKMKKIPYNHFILIVGTIYARLKMMCLS